MNDSVQFICFIAMTVLYFLESARTAKARKTIEAKDFEIEKLKDEIKLLNSSNRNYSYSRESR